MKGGDFINTYYIYKATNIADGKCYVGCTSNIGSRFKQHITCAKNRDNTFHRALDDFGIKNFTWQILETCYAKEDAVTCEAHYIKECNSFVPNGYNETWNNGGPPTTRPIVCLTIDGKFLKRYDYVSQAVKDGYDPSSIRRSLSSICHLSRDCIFMYEDEYLKNGAKKYKKPLSACQKEVVQCDLDGNLIAIYESVTEAANKTGFLRSNISANLSNAAKTSNGYIFVYKKNYPIKELEAHRIKRKGRKVVQIDPKTGEALRVFNRISEAGEYIGKSYKNIQKVLNTPGRTAYGYVWIDYNKFLEQHGNTEVICQCKN